MEAKGRYPAPDLDHRLLSDPKGCSYFQAVRLLLSANPDAAAPGESGPFSDEAVQFLANPSLGFPASDVEELIPNNSTKAAFPPYHMMVNFLGLYGQASPLPGFYSERILQSDDDDQTIRHFLDLFHHRLASYFYRSWEKYRYDVQYREQGNDQFSRYIFSLVGLGHEQLMKGSVLKWSRLLPFIGMLMMRSRPVAMVNNIISYYFGSLPVQIKEYASHRVQIDSTQQNALAQQNCLLGRDVVLSSYVWDCASKYKIVLGPMGFENYCKFQPGGAYYKEIRELLHFVMLDNLAFDIELTLDTSNVPVTELARDNPCRLGHSSWLGECKDDLAVITHSVNA